MFNTMFNKRLEMMLLLFMSDPIQKNDKSKLYKKYAESMLVMRIMEARSCFCLEDSLSVFV